MEWRYARKTVTSIFPSGNAALHQKTHGTRTANVAQVLSEALRRATPALPAVVHRATGVALRLRHDVPVGLAALQVIEHSLECKRGDSVNTRKILAPLPPPPCGGNITSESRDVGMFYLEYASSKKRPQPTDRHCSYSLCFLCWFPLVL